MKNSTCTKCNRLCEYLESPSVKNKNNEFFIHEKWKCSHCGNSWDSFIEADKWFEQYLKKKRNLN